MMERSIVNTKKNIFIKNNTKEDLLEVRLNSRIKLRKDNLDSIISKHRITLSSRSKELKINPFKLKIDNSTLSIDFKHKECKDELRSLLFHKDHDYIKFGILKIKEKITHEDDLYELAILYENSFITKQLFSLLRLEDDSIIVSCFSLKFIE